MTRRNTNTSIPMTSDVAAKIKQLWRDTDLPQHKIAAMVGVNQGRVNEVVNGKRFAAVPPL